MDAGAPSFSRLVVEVLVGIFLRVALGDLEEVGDVVERPVDPLDLGDQGFVSARVLEAVYRRVWVDAGGVYP